MAHALCFKKTPKLRVRCTAGDADLRTASSLQRGVLRVQRLWPPRSGGGEPCPLGLVDNRSRGVAFIFQYHIKESAARESVHVREYIIDSLLPLSKSRTADSQIERHLNVTIMSADSLLT